MNRTCQIALMVACGVSAATAVFETSLLSAISDQNKARKAHAAEVADRSAYALCGVYDVTVTAHNGHGSQEALGAALRFGSDDKGWLVCRDVGTGLPKV
jgi:hypothetical protein